MLHVTERTGTYHLLSVLQDGATGANFLLVDAIGGFTRSYDIKGYMSSTNGRQNENECFHLEFYGSVESLPCAEYWYGPGFPNMYGNYVSSYDNLSDYEAGYLSANTWSSVTDENGNSIGGIVITPGANVTVSLRNSPHHRTGWGFEVEWNRDSVYEFGNVEWPSGTGSKGYCTYKITSTEWWVEPITKQEVYRYTSSGSSRVICYAYTPLKRVANDDYASLEHYLNTWTANRLYHKYITWLPPKPESDLVVDLVKDLKELDINTITAVQGLVNCYRDLKGLVDAAQGHVSVKWLVNLYLQMKYGFANTVRDARDLMLYFAREYQKMYAARQANQKTHAAGGLTYTGTSFKCDSAYEVTHATATVKTMDNTLADLTRQLMDIDVFPELGNVWDIVPFSFVLDWFLPIGSILDAVDANTYRSTLKVESFVWSYKYVLTGIDATQWLPLTGRLVGTVDVQCYERHKSHEIPQPTVQLQIPQQFTQWLPAAALVAQGRLK